MKSSTTDSWSRLGVPQHRVWVSPGGIEYRVWLDPMPHPVRPFLTFMPTLGVDAQVVRRPPPGTVLQRMTDAELGDLFGRDQAEA
jgi:hypothetical protein